MNASEHILRVLRSLSCFEMNQCMQICNSRQGAYPVRNAINVFRIPITHFFYSLKSFLIAYKREWPRGLVLRHEAAAFRLGKLIQY